MTAPVVSVVVRAKDEGASIGRTLRLLSEQTLADRSETIVVDSGSRDDTVAIARAAGARIVEIPAGSFTYGGALNTGASVARGEVVVALSAHAFPRDDRWLERMVSKFDDDRVACVCGYEGGPDGRRLDGPRKQDAEDALRNPHWGFSNINGGFRAELWRSRPFREDMPGTEDHEWGWYWQRHGYVVEVDPELCVEHDHSDEGPLARYRRWHREWAGFAIYVELPSYGLRDLAREWWTEQGGRRSMARARLSPKRAAELLGGYAGRRSGTRRADRDLLVPARPFPSARIPQLRD
jgi:rhamnosyltransferase